MITTMERLTQIQQRLFTSGPVTIFRWFAQDPWTIEYVSPNVNQWGYEAEEFLTGKISYQDIIYPEDIAKITNELKQYETAGIDTYRQDYRLITATGEVRWVYDYSIVVRNSQGIITHYEGYVFDITERKQGEFSLQESEEKFAKAFHCSPDPMTIVRLSDGCFLDVNQSFLEISGYNREEVIGKSSLDFNLWVNTDTRKEIFELLKNQGCVKNRECEFRHKLGHIIIGLFAAEVVSINGEFCLLSVTTDITERKQAETKLLAAAQREKLLGEMATKIRQSLNLQEILDTTVQEVRYFLGVSRVYIVQFNQNIQGKIVAESINENYASILDWKPRNQTHIQEILEYFIFDRVYAFDDLTQVDFPPEITQDFLEYRMRSFLAVPIIVESEFFGHLVAHQCDRVHVWEKNEIDFVTKLANHLAIAIQQGKLYQKVQCLNSNLENLVAKRTAELYQKIQELEELYRIKDVFLHAFSHDLRTPMMGASLVLKSLLNNQNEMITVPRSILERLEQGSERQLNLMNALLEAHSNEISGIVLHRQTLNMFDLIENIIVDLEPLACKYQGKLVNLVNDNSSLFYGDPIHLRRVFENLITNAFKYNPSGLIVSIAANCEDNITRYTVTDNGLGISEQQQHHLFDLYYRNSQNRTATGIGLGLYLCKQIIEAHGGTIGVNSSLGEGTTFWFTLPQ